MGQSQSTTHLYLLEQIAADVIRQLQQVSDFQNDRIAIIGGLAMMKHAESRVPTEDIDFFVTTKGGPQFLKEKLLALPDTPFRERAWHLIYSYSEDLEVYIDLHSEQDFPFTLFEAEIISRVDTKRLPYISVANLLAYKLFSCGLRCDQTMREKDARDARILLKILETPLRLTRRQWEVVEKGIKDAANPSSEDMAWWEKNLGENNF